MAFIADEYILPDAFAKFFPILSPAIAPVAANESAFDISPVVIPAASPTVAPPIIPAVLAIVLAVNFPALFNFTPTGEVENLEIFLLAVPAVFLTLFHILVFSCLSDISGVSLCTPLTSWFPISLSISSSIKANCCLASSLSKSEAFSSFAILSHSSLSSYNPFNLEFPFPAILSLCKGFSLCSFLSLKELKSPADEFVFGNLIFSLPSTLPLPISPEDFPDFPFPKLDSVCNPFIAIAPPAKEPNPLGLSALSKPNIFFINFSAGIKNAIATTAYIGLSTAKSIAEETKTEYNIKWTGCIIAFIVYSLNHILNACAFPSPTLSIGYVNATNGAIIVKNAIYKNLLKYIKVNIHVYITKAK